MKGIIENMREKIEKIKEKKIKENKIKENKIKNNIYIFGAMLIFTIIICSNFFKVHFAQDTYCVYIDGYDNYIHHFLMLGRVFSALQIWLTKVLNIPFEAMIVLSSVISMFLFAMTWFILYRCTMKLIKKENSILIAGIIFPILYNFCTFETMIFVESSVMALSIFLSVLSACIYTSDIKNKNIFTFMILGISVLCYQTSASLFVLISLVFIAYKYKNNIKEIFKKSIGVFLFWGVSMIISLGLTKIMQGYFQAINRETTLLSIGEMIDTIIRFGKILVLENLSIGPKGWYLAFIVILSVIFVIREIKTKEYFHIFEYIVLVLVACLLPLLPLIVIPVANQYIESRMAMSFGAVLGVILLYLTIVMKKDIETKDFTDKIVCMIVIVLFAINSIYFIRASSENMATGYMDRNIAKAILQQIADYEKENNIKIENIVIGYDANATTYYDGQLKLRSTTARGMVTDYAVIQTLKYYSGINYNAVYQAPKEVKEKFSQLNWDYYSDKQLFFEGNTLYICLY